MSSTDAAVPVAEAAAAASAQPLEALAPVPDSDYESERESVTSSTQSVTSSLREYIYENGRRYHRHGDADYHIPNDEAEQDRLDLYHHIFLLLLNGKLHLAPIPEKVHRVLDAGTGTGIWALDFGEIHPEAEVVGVDLSPIQPSWVYPNVKFEVDNLDQEWTWKENYFDFIHARYILDGIKDHDQFVKNAYKHLAPGGWVEISEWEHHFQAQDDSYGEDSVFRQFFTEYQRCCALAGQNVIDFVNPITKSMEEAGFTDIKAHKLLVPMGGWPKDKRLRDIGRHTGQSAGVGIESYSLSLLTKFGGYSAEKAKTWAAAAMKEVYSRKIHIFYWQYHIVARKPEVEEK